MTRAARWLILLAIIIEALLFVLRGLSYSAGGLRHHVSEVVSVLLAVSILYLVACYLADTRAGKTRDATKWILTAAVVFRITLWSLFPAFSDDVFRYRWEGRVQAAGGNPYRATPNDPAWRSLRDPTFGNIPAPDFKAGYGPLDEMIEWLNYRVVSRFVSQPFAQAFWFKLPAALCDLGILAALTALLTARGLPTNRVLIYAWSPLAIFEFWVSGHNDAIAVLLVVLALLAAARESWTWAFAALAAAVGAKFWPLLLLPLFARRAPSWKRLWPVIPIWIALVWPYRANVIENARFMSGFVGGWRNNDSLFGALLWLTGDLYRAKYLAFALIALVVAWMTFARWPLENASLAVLVAALLISANCHPWYLSWFLPLLAFIPSPALLLWTALVPLAYRVLFDWFALGEWNGSTDIRWYIYIPVYAMLCTEVLRAQHLIPIHRRFR